MKKFNKNSFLHFFTYKKKMCLKSYVLLNNDFVEDGCKAFSLVELMLSLIIISLIAAAFTPVITKKLNRGSIVAGGSTGEISNDCNRGNSDETYSFSSDCELCTKSYCITCNKSCSSGQYVTKKCQCASCSDFDNDGISCKSCTQNGCSECESGYISAGKCKTCPTGGICDGKTKLDTCPSGYYCEDGKQVACTKFDSNCTSCTKSGCTGCVPYYAPQDNKCKRCPDGCYSCSTPDYCILCTNWNHLDNGKCYACHQSNCKTCNASIDSCEECGDGYFLNSSGSCTKCEVSNCATCQNGTSADTNSQKCSICNTGYYVTTDGKCAACSALDSNCIVCSSDGKCSACNSGYSLNSSKTGCDTDDKTEFKCSDENFMRYGNLCFTRRNMGDSVDLTIPSDIPIRSAGQNCPSYYSKCCWRTGTTDCANTDDYSSCNPVVCNYAAAEAICKSFSYYKTGWQVTSNDDLWKVSNYANSGLGSNGIQFYSWGASYTCNGAKDNYCEQGRNWSRDSVSIVQQSAAGANTGYNAWEFNRYYGAAVRCVLDMGN